MDDNHSFQFFLDFYADIPRQGPGDDRITRHILGLLTDLPENPDVIDMGCGSGAQTMILAQEGCRVTAVDVHQVMIDNLDKRLHNETMKDRVTGVCSGMESYRPESPVDLIWSEGAVYIIGFTEGLTLWQPYLKEGGYLVISELTWLVDDPPSEVATYWATEYPAMQSVSGNMAIINKTGYRWMGSVLLPDHAWDTFYAHQKEKIARLRSPGFISTSEEAVLQTIEEEIRMFEQYRGTYGYVFYLMQRIA